MGRRVVVIEDSEQLRTLIKMALSGIAEVRTAKSLVEAWNQLGDAFAPELVITDFDLGESTGQDGLSVAEAFRDRFPAIPILVTTGTSIQHPRLARLLELPGVTLLQKPFDPDELCAVVERL
ncbi:MAG: hypothetical protein RJB38_2145 [Pseudomonadota bacterium]|jgi:DNA-binding NtrC family response regulator